MGSGKMGSDPEYLADFGEYWGQAPNIWLILVKFWKKQRRKRATETKFGKAKLSFESHIALDLLGL